MDHQQLQHLPLCAQPSLAVEEPARAPGSDEGADEGAHQTRVLRAPLAPLAPWPRLAPTQLPWVLGVLMVEDG